MIAVLRTTLSMVMVALACAFACASSAMPATAAPAPPGGGMAECNELDLDDPAAIRAYADAEGVTDVFAGRILKAEERTSVGGGEGKANGSGGSPSEPPPNNPNTRTTGWEHVVEVVFPFRSALQRGDKVVVVTAIIADEGLGRLQAGDAYLFFAAGEEGKNHLDAGGCSGTRQLPGGLTAGIRDAVSGAFDEPADDAVDYTLSTPDDGARATPSLGRLAAPGAALALLGVLGLLLLARISARRT